MKSDWKLWWGSMAVACAVVVAVCLGTAHAQQLVQQGDGSAAVAFGQVVNTGDTLTLKVSGAQYATVKVDFAGCNSNVTANWSRDGLNFVGAPMGVRTDFATANPTYTLFSSTVGGTSTYEFPLPANAVAFQITAAVGFAGGTVRIRPGAVYVPWVPVSAVLYDLTGGTNAQVQTPVLDLSGWQGITVTMSGTATPNSFTDAAIDDNGSSYASVVSTSPQTLVFAQARSYTVAATGSLSGMPRRQQFTNAAIATGNSRIRIEAYR